MEKLITISNGYDKNVFYKEECNKKEVLQEFNIDKEYDKIKAKYNNGKILIYIDKFIQEKEKSLITNVLSLYDVVDQMVYCVTEEEALHLFDSSIDTSSLKNKERMLKERNHRKII